VLPSAGSLSCAQGWSGDHSGCALLLASLEASWGATGARQSAQVESCLAADAAASSAAAAASARREGWRALEAEVGRLPEVVRALGAARAGLEAALQRCQELSSRLDAADAGAAQLTLRARAAAEERALAAAEEKHSATMRQLVEQRASWAQQAQHALRALPHAEHQAAAHLTRSLRTATIGGGGGFGGASAQALASMELDLSSATSRLRAFLEGSPDAPQPQPQRGAEAAEEGDTYRPRRRPRGEGEKKRRHRKREEPARADGGAYLSFKGYQDPVSLIVQGDEDTWDAQAAAAAPAATPPPTRDEEEDEVSSDADY